MTVPQWFLGDDALFDFLFFIVTMFVTIYAYRAYKFFSKPHYLKFSIGFGLMSFGYFILSVRNALIYLNETPGVQLSIEKAVGLSTIIPIFTTARSVITLVAWLLLLFFYLKIKDRLLQSLVFLLTFVGFLLPAAEYVKFFALSSILVLFIIIKLFHHYLVAKKSATLYVLLGFSAIFVSKILDGIVLLTGLGDVYVISYVIKLIGFLSILYVQVRK